MFQCGSMYVPCILRLAVRGIFTLWPFGVGPDGARLAGRTGGMQTLIAISHSRRCLLSDTADMSALADSRMCDIADVSGV